MAEFSTLARPYAQAAFEVAMSNNVLEDLSREITLLATVCEHEKISRALAKPSLTGEQRAGILIELCGDELSQKGQNFVRILAENKRLDLLPAILEQFSKKKAEQESTLDVRVVSARPLDKKTEEKLTKALSKRMQREVSIQIEINESLIGGVVVYAGDLVIDDSVRGKINKLAEAMKS